MSILIKICGFTREVDVEAAIEAGVDAVGLVFAPSPSCTVSFSRARSLLAVASGAAVKRIAVVGEMGRDEAQRICDLGFDGVQWVLDVHHTLPTLDGGFVLPVLFDGEDVLNRFQMLSERSPQHLQGEEGFDGLVSIDSAGGGGMGVKADWSRAASLARRARLMLAGGLRAENVAEALGRVAPRAVDVSSGVESAPGVKSAAAMRSFCQAVRGASLSSECGGG